MEYICKICGYKLEVKPWGEDGRTPTFDICPCCGVEFGYEDATPIAIERYFTKWVTDGYKWFDLEKKPQNWKIEEQLKNIDKN